VFIYLQSQLCYVQKHSIINGKMTKHGFAILHAWITWLNVLKQNYCHGT